RLDTAFRVVIEACASTPRAGQQSTWITRDLIEAYCELHRLGFAHSVEALAGGELVGGLYGVSLGRFFFRASMFARAEDASKIAFVTLAERLCEQGITLCDCQVQTEHMARFGAQPWPRARFLSHLAEAMRKPTWRGPWSFG